MAQHRAQRRRSRVAGAVGLALAALMVFMPTTVGAAPQASLTALPATAGRPAYVPLAYAPPPALSPHGNNLVMWLGDSIARGQGSSCGGVEGDGARVLMHNWLYTQNETHNVVDVGSVVTGCNNWNHEGHGGWTVELIDNGVQGGWLKNPPSAADGPPQFVMLMAGANNLPTDSVDVIVSKLSALLDHILAVSDNRVVMFEVPVQSGNNNHQLSDNSAKTRELNLRLPGLVQSKVGGRIALAHTGIIELSDMAPDGVHPNNDGYLKMAWLGYRALAPWLGRYGGHMVNADGPFPFDVVNEAEYTVQ